MPLHLQRDSDAMAGVNVQTNPLQAGPASHQKPASRSGSWSAEENPIEPKREGTSLHYQEHIKPPGKSIFSS